MIPAPKRRWFRFSLRTLFVVVTVVGCWLGYQLNWIRQRHAALPDWTSAIGDAVDPEDPFADGPSPPRFAPGLLWVFGETGYYSLSRRSPPNPDGNLAAEQQIELSRVKLLFPEARVTWRVER